jgi:hypothetical protein
MAPAREHKSIWSVIVPTDGTRAANMRDRGLRYVADFEQLSDKPLLASVLLFGVSKRKAQWRIETLMRRGSVSLCWRRCPLSRPEVAAVPSMILDGGI